MQIRHEKYYNSKDSREIKLFALNIVTIVTIFYFRVNSKEPRKMLLFTDP